MGTAAHPLTWLLLAAALLIQRRGGKALAQPRRPRLPVVTGLGLAAAAFVLGGPVGGWAALPLGALGWWLARRYGRTAQPPLARAELAVVLDLVAAGLLAGLPVPAAIDSVSRSVERYGGQRFEQVIRPFQVLGRLLALGADPAHAWSELAATDGLRAVAGAGRRCAHSGARLAGALTEAAEELRAEHLAEALHRSERIGVWTLLPLGCCFLPAFMCLGVFPVVIGIAEQAFGSGGLALQ
ncbi:MAG TPA: type II secretion system F family protein [Jatrophihabitans sp.]|nr:type II secretion system F family protein [Jatrophihabitans sp.]